MDDSSWMLCNQYQEVVISPPTFHAGRSSDLDLVCRSNLVSRNHALFIVYPNGTLHVLDNQSANGTYINRRRIDPNRLRQLHVNDEVGLGLHSQLNVDALGPNNIDDVRYIFTVRKRLSNEVIVLDDPAEGVCASPNLVNGVTDSPLTSERLVDILDSDNDENRNIELPSTSRAGEIKGSDETRSIHQYDENQPSTSASAINHPTSAPQSKKEDKPLMFASSVNSLQSNVICEKRGKAKDKKLLISLSPVNHLESHHTLEPKKKKENKPSTSASAINHPTSAQQSKKEDKPLMFASSVNSLQSTVICEKRGKAKDKKPLISLSPVNHLDSHHTLEPKKKKENKPSTSNHVQRETKYEPQEKGNYVNDQKEMVIQQKPQEKGNYVNDEKVKMIKQKPQEKGNYVNDQKEKMIKQKPQEKGNYVNDQKEKMTKQKLQEKGNYINDQKETMIKQKQQEKGNYVYGEKEKMIKQKPQEKGNYVNDQKEMMIEPKPQEKGNYVNDEKEMMIKQERLYNINNHNGNNYTIEDGCIIIDDDDDQFPCSQLFNDEPTSNHIVEDFLNESIFCSIKKELEELDKPEDGRVYACVDLIDTDGEGEGSQDWLFDDEMTMEKDEENKNCQTDLQSNQSNISKENNDHTLTKLTLSKNRYVIPPVIAPHVEIKLKSQRRRERVSETIKPEKRKMVEKENEQAKKIKTSTFYNTNNKSDAGWKRKRKEAVRKETKEQIHELRKKKLKEIAGKKSEEKETKTSKCKIATAKVKLSDSRGKFLTQKIDMPSTSRAVHTSVHNSLPPRNASVPTNSCASNKSTNLNTSTVHNNNHVQHPKPTPFVPKSVIPVHTVARAIPKNFEGIRDILISFLNWKTVWFQKWKVDKKPPPIHDKPLTRVSQNFSNYMDYYNTVMPLLELELWNYMIKGINEENEPRNKKFLAQIVNEIKMDVYTELKCFTYITKEQYETMSYIREEDAVIVQFAFRQSEAYSITIPMLGYVTETNKKVLNDKDFMDADFGKELGIEPHVLVGFKVLVQAFNGKVELEKYMHIRIIASLIPTTRIIRSVKYLERSSLCQHVLKPTFPLYSLSRVRQEKLFSRDNLNAAQYQAVMEATDICLRKDPGIYLIQGPPGTGKSTVIINIIQQILFRELNNNSKQCCILVVAPSNAAVDELTTRLIKLKPKLEAAERKEIKLVRVGPKNMINSAVQDYTLQELAKRNVIDTFLNREHNSMVPRHLVDLQQRIVTLREIRNSPEADSKLNATRAELESCCRRALGRSWNDNFKRTEENLLGKARIICTTLSSCVGLRIQDVFGGPSKKFQCCIVDEATQSTEQETLIPLMLGIDKIVLVGDPKQLPAVTLSKEAKDYAYGQSLFSRIMSNFERKSNNPIRMLDTQYRMHPAICEFPNKTYYGGNLKNASTIKTRLSKLNILKPYLVFNLKMQQCNSQEYSNKAEIDCVVKLLDAIVMNIKDSCAYSVGIVTPYNSQKQDIKTKIKSKAFRPNLAITVNTVDSFQGQEKDIIIMSCVRDYSNKFVSDEQRLNVAMTRAKHALYIIGSDSLLQTCASLGKVYDDAKRRYLLQVVSSRTSVMNLSNVIRSRH